MAQALWALNLVWQAVAAGFAFSYAVTLGAFFQWQVRAGDDEFFTRVYTPFRTALGLKWRYRLFMPFGPALTAAGGGHLSPCPGHLGTQRVRNLRSSGGQRPRARQRLAPLAGLPHPTSRKQTMRYFAQYIVGRNGPIDVFLQPQTPRLIAEEVARKLTSPAYLDGARHFAVVVWALPDGMTHMDEVPESSPARATFIQCGGSAAAMSVEIRVTHEDDSYEHYAVAREPVTDPGAWTTITWDNGGPEPFSLRLHPEEVFTGEQAAPVFRAYIEDGALPPARLLRRLDV